MAELGNNYNNSYGTSWADQWDPLPEYYDKSSKKSSGAGMASKYGKKVGDGLGKTKSVASNGAKKVKEGTSIGLQWLKDKYHNKKTTAHNKH